MWSGRRADQRHLQGVPGTDYAVYDMIYRESKAKSSYVTFDADWQISDNLTATFQAGSYAVA